MSGSNGKVATTEPFACALAPPTCAFLRHDDNNNLMIPHLRPVLLCDACAADRGLPAPLRQRPLSIASIYDEFELTLETS